MNVCNMSLNWESITVLIAFANCCLLLWGHWIWYSLLKLLYIKCLGIKKTALVQWPNIAFVHIFSLFGPIAATKKQLVKPLPFPFLYSIYLEGVLPVRNIVPTHFLPLADNNFVTKYYDLCPSSIYSLKKWLRSRAFPMLSTLLWQYILSSYWWLVWFFFPTSFSIRVMLFLCVFPSIASLHK